MNKIHLFATATAIALVGTSGLNAASAKQPQNTLSASLSLIGENTSTDLGNYTPMIMEILDDTESSHDIMSASIETIDQRTSVPVNAVIMNKMIVEE